MWMDRFTENGSILRNFFQLAPKQAERAVWSLCRASFFLIRPQRSCSYLLQDKVSSHWTKWFEIKCVESGFSTHVDCWSGFPVCVFLQDKQPINESSNWQYGCLLLQEAVTDSKFRQDWFPALPLDLLLSFSHSIFITIFNTMKYSLLRSYMAQHKFAALMQKTFTFRAFSRHYYVQKIRK